MEKNAVPHTIPHKFISFGRIPPHNYPSEEKSRIYPNRNYQSISIHHQKRY